METATPTALSLMIHIDHQGCPKAEEWRKANGEHGFPKFVPAFHERYNPSRTFLECEACKTHISHSLVSTTEIEST